MKFQIFQQIFIYTPYISYFFWHVYTAFKYLIWNIKLNMHIFIYSNLFISAFTHTLCLFSNSVSSGPNL